MVRASLIAALALSTLAPTSAAAEDCMCFVPDFGARSLHVEQSVEVGPFFSSDGTLLSSVSIELDRDGQAPATEILWCWSADDPRCSPADPPQDDGPRAPRTAPSFATVGGAVRWPALDEEARPLRPEAEDGAREGVQARIERPPRA